MCFLSRHTLLGIGSFGRPGLNVSGGEVAGVRWRAWYFSFFFCDLRYYTIFILTRGFSFHFFILFWLLCAFYYCKSLLPTIGRLDPRVPPDSVLLHSTVKLAPETYPLRLISLSSLCLFVHFQALRMSFFWLHLQIFWVRSGLTVFTGWCDAQRSILCHSCCWYACTFFATEAIFADIIFQFFVRYVQCMCQVQIVLGVDLKQIFS